MGWRNTNWHMNPFPFPFPFHKLTAQAPAAPSLDASRTITAKEPTIPPALGSLLFPSVALSFILRSLRYPLRSARLLRISDPPTLVYCPLSFLPSPTAALVLPFPPLPSTTKLSLFLLPRTTSDAKTSTCLRHHKAPQHSLQRVSPRPSSERP